MCVVKKLQFNHFTDKSMIFKDHPLYVGTNVKPPLEYYRLAKTLVQRLAVCDAAPPGLKMATLPR